MRKLILLLFLLPVWSLPARGMDYERIKRAYQLSYQFERRGEYARAREALLPVYENFPRGYTVNLRLGWLFYLEGHYRNAIHHYRIAAAVAPGAVEPLLGLSLPYLAQKNWTRVEALMYQVLKRDFYNYYGNLRLAVALRKEGKYAQAEAVCRKMLTLYPTDTAFLTELALDLYQQGKRRRALEIFRNILILDPANPVASKYVSP
ncbi:tetratricopeptide repeat protein [Thermosulfurimonas sp.]|uniref:tetratricopeptide repeat protein n=1 Tax=Thermosulfurimonas sp. TaxID=2080236 RepID=UPI0025DE4EBE|nr:tetratricopeptide repeat protein [Thermosulfurimonas sp.]